MLAIWSVHFEPTPFWRAYINTGLTKLKLKIISKGMLQNRWTDGQGPFILCGSNTISIFLLSMIFWDHMKPSQTKAELQRGTKAFLKLGFTKRGQTPHDHKTVWGCVLDVVENKESSGWMKGIVVSKMASRAEGQGLHKPLRAMLDAHTRMARQRA